MVVEGPMGMIERRAGRSTLRFTRVLAHAPESVWSALTESDHMRWWMPAEMIGDRVLAATVRMRFWPDLVEAKGLEPDAGTATIERWEPPTVFAWVWHGTRIRFDLAPTGTGSQLHLTVDIDSDDPDVIVDNAGGYHLWMDLLETLLTNGPGTSVATAGPRTVETAYRAMVAEAP